MGKSSSKLHGLQGVLNIGHISGRGYRSKYNKMPFDAELMKMWHYIWAIRRELENG